MNKENNAQMKPEINDFFKKRVKKQVTDADVVEIDPPEIDIDPLVLPNPPVPEIQEVIIVDDSEKEVEKVDEQAPESGLDNPQRMRSSRHGSKPRPSYYINMDYMSMDNVTRSSIIKQDVEDSNFSVGKEKPKPSKKPNLMKKKKINPAAFFMTPKERLEQAQIERSLRMQSEMMEATKLSNHISQATGKSTNPFFNPRQHKPMGDNSGDSGKKVTQPAEAVKCPFPDSSQCHVGWSWTAGSATLSNSHTWKCKPVVCDSQALEGDYTVVFQKYNPIDTINIDNLLYIKKDRLLDFVNEHYVKYDETIPTITKWFMEQVSLLETPIDNRTLAWTEVCIPKSINSIVGTQNRKVCQNIVDWLDTWSSKPEKFGCFKKKMKSDKKRKRYDDFVTSDEESEMDFSMNSDSDLEDLRVTVGYEPVMMILGQSGKTMISNVAANIAGYHVLELNTSSKRSGKILIDLLTNATTTHTVKTKRKNEEEQSQSTRGKTMILIDDADILFEDDKGFWTSLLQVIHSAKCPIILTCTDNPLREDNPMIPSGISDLRSSIQICQLQLPSSDEVLVYCGLQAIKLGYFLEPELLIRLLNRSQFIGPNILRLQYYCLSLTRRRDRNSNDWCYPISKSDIDSILESKLLDTCASTILKSEVAKLVSDSNIEDENQHKSIYEGFLYPYFSSLGKMELDYSQYETRLNIYQNYDPEQIATNPIKINTEIFPFVELMCRSDVETEQGIVKAGLRRTRRSLASRHLDFMTHEEELLFIYIEFECAFVNPEPMTAGERDVSLGFCCCCDGWTDVLFTGDSLDCLMPSLELSFTMSSKISPSISGSKNNGTATTEEIRKTADKNANAFIRFWQNSYQTSEKVLSGTPSRVPVQGVSGEADGQVSL